MTQWRKADKSKPSKAWYFALCILTRAEASGVVENLTMKSLNMEPMLLVMVLAMRN